MNLGFRSGAIDPNAGRPAFEALITIDNVRNANIEVGEIRRAKAVGGEYDGHIECFHRVVKIECLDFDPELDDNLLGLCPANERKRG